MKEKLLIVLCIGMILYSIFSVFSFIKAADIPANAIPRKGDPVSVLYVQETDNTYSAIRNAKPMPVTFWADSTRWIYTTDFNYNVTRLSVTVKAAVASTINYLTEHSVAANQNATYGIYETSETSANLKYGGKVVANGMGGQNTIIPVATNTPILFVVDLAAAGDVCINAQGTTK